MVTSVFGIAGLDGTYAVRQSQIPTYKWENHELHINERDQSQRDVTKLEMQKEAEIKTDPAARQIPL